MDRFTVVNGLPEVQVEGFLDELDSIEKVAGIMGKIRSSLSGVRKGVKAAVTGRTGMGASLSNRDRLRALNPKRSGSTLARANYLHIRAKNPTKNTRYMEPWGKKGMRTRAVSGYPAERKGVDLSGGSKLRPTPFRSDRERWANYSIREKAPAGRPKRGSLRRQVWWDNTVKKYSS